MSDQDDGLSERDAADLAAMHEGIDLSSVPPEHRQDIAVVDRLGAQVLTIIPGSSLLVTNNEGSITFRVQVGYSATLTKDQADLLLMEDDDMDAMVRSMAISLKLHIESELDPGDMIDPDKED